MGNHSLTEYPLLGDGAWREAFPPAWLDEGEETARTGKFVVRDVLINQAGAVSFSAIIPSGDELSITIDLDELSLVQVVPSSSTVAEPDYRDVIAALRHAEIQVAPESPPIQSAESELSVENEPLSEPTSGNTRLPQTSPAKKKTAPIATNAAAAPALTQWLSDLPEMDADETLQLTYHLQPGPNTRAAHPVYGVVVHERDSDGGFLPFSLQHLPQDGSISHADTNILLRLSAIAHEFPAAPVLPLRGQVGALLLHEILQTERCFIHGAPDEDDPCALADPLPCRAAWIADNEGLQRPGFAPINRDTEIAGVLPTSPPHYVAADLLSCGRIDSDLPSGLANQWLEAPEVDVDQIAATRSAMAQVNPDIPLPTEFEIEEIHGTLLRPILSLADENILSATANNDEIGFDGTHFPVASLSFDYSGKRVRHGRESDHIRYCQGSTVYYIPRRYEEEQSYFDLLAATSLQHIEQVLPDTSGLRPRFQESFTFDPKKRPALQWRHFLNKELRKLEEDGWNIEIDEFFSQKSSNPDSWFSRLGTSGKEGWFELECGVVVDGEEISIVKPLAQFASKVESLDEIDGDIEIGHPDHKGTITLEAARVRQILRSVGELFDPAAAKANSSRISIPELRAAELVAHERETLGLDAPASERLATLSDRLTNLGTLSPADPHPEFVATLRPYQLEGFRWLQFLRETGLSGVLADDMGLGKTVQTLCHLYTEHRSERPGNLPSLVIAPTSLVPNWAAEVEKFCPHMKVMRLEGGNRHRLYQHLGEVDVIITSYPILVRDLEILENQPFHCCILDEAQQIKNPSSRTSRSVRALTARHRLCLSGTPVENNLGELWSMFCFLIPGLLGSREAFKRVYQQPIENSGDPERQSHLQRKLAPLMLRRTKESVATDLPPKTIVVHKVPLKEEQGGLYNSMRKEMKESFDAEEPSSILLIQALLKLRQLCCHPKLLGGAQASAMESAKLEHLLSLIENFAPAGRRILVFSQFTSMLDIIAGELKARGLTYCHLDGSTQDRGAVVKKFQEGSDPVFLISLKAGGTGLNLTKADVVIHYDPWWNPAAEAQATDRAYRIGQENPVFVYKLIAEGTVEERILTLQQEKTALANGLLGEGGNGAAFSVKDIDINLLLTPVGAEATL